MNLLNEKLKKLTIQLLKSIIRERKLNPKIKLNQSKEKLINDICKHYEDKTENKKPIGIYGGKLPVNDLHALLNKTYDEKISDYNNYKVDKKLSGPLGQVYFNKDRNQTIISHRGTTGIDDVITDIALLAGEKVNQRWNDGQKLQKYATDKYDRAGAKISAIGHSLGASIAQEMGKIYGSDEIITLNRPVLPYELFERVPENQYDIKTENDPVSMLRRFQFGNKAIFIPSETRNPITEHSVDTLLRLAPDTVFGEGVKKKRKNKNSIKQLKIKTIKNKTNKIIK